MHKLCPVLKFPIPHTITVLTKLQYGNFWLTVNHQYRYQNPTWFCVVLRSTGVSFISIFVKEQMESLTWFCSSHWFDLFDGVHCLILTLYTKRWASECVILGKEQKEWPLNAILVLFAAFLSPHWHGLLVLQVPYCPFFANWLIDSQPQCNLWARARAICCFSKGTACNCHWGGGWRVCRYNGHMPTFAAPGATWPCLLEYVI